ncbi:hypothetical protein PG999_007931 [Apiospora kogelbergensis]|uniref:Uncharacterized protein n=1 Tax=Apiospora kogelbergensis TaxID=1337665 RepID=A0AAW0QT52_9PEZI
MTSPHIDIMAAAISPTTAIATTPRHVRSRTQSISSDRPSTIAHSFMTPPQSVSPEAAFIAASAASQIVTNDHDSHLETWYDQVGIEPSGETALVATGALQLANNFVDQLLFNIIAIARTTSLSALRPAVSEVLKPKLARDAVNQADEELREYLGGGEVEDLVQSPGAEQSHDWDLELAWKRTRLRCMVYSSLGDMEEEDEDYHMEQEHLRGEGDDILSEAVSPAVAIFLTSILEFMGEQVLVIAGQAAFNRLRVKYEKELKDGTRMPGDISDRIVVEELDMERVALDRTLGRLWRAWKKRIRAPAELSYQRSFTRSVTHSRHGSIAGDTLGTLPISREVSIDESQDTSSPKESKSNEKTTKEVRPSAVPLPMSNNDVAEIEVPGLVSYSDEEDSDLEDDEPLKQRPRPKSWMVFSTRQKHNLPTPTASQPASPVRKNRKRANSVPTPLASPLASMPADVPTVLVEPNSNAGFESSTIDSEASTPASSQEAAPEVPERADIQTIEQADANVMPASPISKIVTGAAAVTSAALAGVAAIAHGTAPQTVVTPMVEEEEEELDEFTEEPQIMTSSRISIGGRSSPANSESGPTRPPSIIVGRSNSLRSVRMIEVHSPRSPSARSSRHGSGEFDYPTVARSMSLSREGSVSTPPIAEEGASDPRIDLSAGDAYSSRESSRERNVRRTSSPSFHGYGAPTSAPTYAPTLWQAEPFLDIDTRPERAELPPRMSSYSKPPTLPTLPEKSANRPAYTQSSSAGPSSADRTTSRASPESPKRRPKPNDSPTSTNSNKFKAVRSSEESSSQRAHDVARNFEELLQNDETIQYTLTPENMRDMEISQATKANQSTEQLADSKGAIKNDDSKHPERSRSSSMKRSLSLNKSTGLSSHPPQVHGDAKLAGPVPRAPPVSMATQGRMGAGQARDARIPRESLQDFAQFIRSTGPPGGPGNPPANRPVANTGAHRRDISGPAPASATIAVPPKRTASTRARLQARDAAVSSNNESSDLIDFIRRGPPSNGPNPRIPRNIAPFRNTMDSDQFQMSGATGGRAVDAALPDVRTSQAPTEASVNSSINSQSALLNKANKPANYSNNFDEEDMMPKRKQRRVRDPYAIDFSDEEDLDDLLEEAPKPKPKPKKEESLVDFLNNYDPPPDPSPPQPFITSKQPAVLKKKSTTNLISRLRAGGSSSTADRSATPAATGRESRTASNASNGGRGYTPIVASMPPNGGNAGKFNEAMGPPISQNRAPTGGRVPMKHYEPRDATPSQGTRASGTSDLARFLRESEPPPSTLASAPPPPEEKPSGFSRIFERRKKSVAY